MNSIQVTANVAKEIYEIASDFANPIEVVREAVHNSYDAGASELKLIARVDRLPDGRRALSIDVVDDGVGMTPETLTNLFGLGYSDKVPSPDRRPIGFKGHGTKIYYQAQDLLVATRQKDKQLLVAILENARQVVYQKRLPQPRMLVGEEASAETAKHRLELPRDQGTTIRLIDFTPDSGSLIDSFGRIPLENYLRWFTVFGSFEHVIKGTKPSCPMDLLLQGTGEKTPSRVSFGHAWPESDQTNLKELKKLDDRRPFNFFRKTFRMPDFPIEGGYRIDIAALFEGQRSRLERDKCVSRQRAGGLYAEEERYGLWLCRDYIPVDKRFEWLTDDECPRIAEDLRRPLLFVNCQDFLLTANRGSVGNSSPELLEAVRKGVYEFLNRILVDDVDKDLERFFQEYQEEVFSRRREKDKRALTRRINRYNAKKRCKISLPDGRTHEFWAPTREITLFGLIAELQVVDPSILGIDILDYDDHSGIDMLVRRNSDPGNLLGKDKVAYVELKYELTAQINHAFENLHSIVCWESGVHPDDFVVDAANNRFTLQENEIDGVTHSRLVPSADSKLSHNIQVLVLRRFLREKYHLQETDNPNRIAGSK